MAEQRPVDTGDGASTKWGKKFKFDKFVSLSRALAAFKSEATASAYAMQCTKFVRAFEGARCDGAVIIDGPTFAQINIPQDSTGRHFVLRRHLGGHALQNAIFVDFKSLQWRPNVNKAETEAGPTVHKMLNGIMQLTREQNTNCQALILSNFLEPNWIAVIPRPYFQISLRDPRDLGPKGQNLYMGVIASGMLQKVPLPSALIPFMMPESMLGNALDNLATCAEVPGTQLYNPYTGLPYDRCKTWEPELRNFDELFPAASTEYTIRRVIWDAFRGHELATGFIIKMPNFQPVSSDMRVDHTSGTSIFIEIKVACWEVRTLADGRQRFSHDYRLGRPGQKALGYFTFAARWDYMLTADASGNKCYLIRRDEFPDSFWHRIPTNGEKLVHTYADTTFLGAREVSLNQPMSEIRDNIRRIICGQDINGAPVRASLEWDEIVQKAGPCPKLLLSRPSDMVDADDTDDAGELDLANDDETKSTYATPIAQARHTVEGGRESIREGQLFDLLLHECRVRGSGCPIWLGLFHPMGPIGFIRHRWSDAEKRTFDKTAKPPCWIGPLDNDTNMITILQRLTRWRLPHEYAPDEGTASEVAQTTAAKPCLVVCTGIPREVEHMRQQVWLVPSEFFPMAHLGKIKAVKVNKDPAQANYRLPLFLKGQHTIDRFAVNTHQLHDIIMRFLGGADLIDVGDGVQVDPKPYIRTVKEVRISSDVNFETCLKG